MPKQTTVKSVLYAYVHRLLSRSGLFAICRSLIITPVFSYTRTRAMRAGVQSRSTRLSAKKLAGIFVVTTLTLVTMLITGLIGGNQQPNASAAPADTLNFQARLQTSSGAIVPDGSYTIQFKLYDVASGGSSLWTETDTVSVVNGYVSVYLGDTTPFPSGIAWDQAKYVTMNVNSDGEMTPRLKLTAVPYSFMAKYANQLQASSGANIATLSFTTPTATNNILLPNASGTVCLNSSSSCGFAPGTAGSYIQNGTSVQASNFYVQSAAAGSVTAKIQGHLSQSVNIVEVYDGAGTLVQSVGNTGDMLVQPSSNSADAFKVQTSSGTDVLRVDTGSEAVYVTGYSNGFGLISTPETNAVATNSQQLVVRTGNALGTNSDSGAIGFVSGDSSDGVSGLAIMLTGSAQSTSGAVYILTGESYGGTAGDVNIDVGVSNTGTGTINIGTTNAGLMVLGNSGTSTTLSGNYSFDAGQFDLKQGSFYGTLAQASLAQNVTYTLPDPGGATATICLTTGNCAGSGGGLTGSGTSNYVARFNTSSTLNSSSLLYDNGTFVGVNTTTDNGQLSILSTSASKTGLYVQAAGSATTPALLVKGGATPGAGGNLISFQNSSGNVLSGFNSSGQLFNTGGSYTGTISQASLAQNVTYTLPDPGGATATICLTTGNCAGSGGGITGSGTSGYIAKFNGSGAITNSGLSESGTTLTYSGNLTGLTGLTVTSGGASITGATTINTTGTANTQIGNGTGTFQLDSSALDISTSGALSGITTISASGAITAATSTNTINGLIISSGSLSGITGYTQTSGNFAMSGTGTFGTGTGNISLNGATSVTGTNSFTVGSGTVTLGSLGAGVVQSSAGGVLSSSAIDRNSATLLSNALNVSNGGTGATTLTANGILYGNGTSAIQATAAAANSILATNGSNVPSLTQTLPTAVQGNITSTGALASGSIASGFGTISTGNNITTSATVQGNLVNATTGFQVNGAATSGNYLRGNGTNFVSSALQAGDISGTLFTLAGTTGVSQAVSSGGTVTIARGSSNNLTSVASATNTITLDIVSNPTFTGQITSVGVNSGTGSIQGTGGLSVTGTTTINTTGTANTQIGNATGTFQLDSSAFDVSTAGALSGITGYTQTSGNFAMSGTGTFGTGTGNISLNGATSVTGTNTLTVGTGATTLGGTLGVTGLVTLSNNISFSSGANRTISVATQTVANTSGNNLSITAAQGNGTGAGGDLNITSGASGTGATGDGGAVNITGGSAVSSSGYGGSVVMQGGTGTYGGGSITINGGSGSGGTNNGGIAFGTSNTADITIGATGNNTYVQSNYLYIGALASSNYLYSGGSKVLKTDSRFLITQGTASTAALSVRTTGNSFDLIALRSDGKIYFGDGATSADTNLYRSTTTTLKTDNAFIAGTTITAGTGLTVTSGGATITAGGLTVTAGGASITGTTTINTTGTANTQIGNATGTFQLDSSAFDVSTAGALSGITGYTQTSGTFSQTYSASTATSANAISFTNSNSTATPITVNGLSITSIGSANANSNANTINAINLPNVTTITNNAFNGLYVGTGYNNILNYNGTSIINGTGVLQSAGLSGTYSNALTLNNASNSYNGLTLSSASDGFTVAGGTTSRTLTVTGANITIGSTIQPTAAGTLSVKSNGANALTLDVGSAAAVNIGATANAVNIASSGNTTTINGALTVAANQNFTMNSGSGTFSQTYSASTATSAQSISVSNTNTAGAGVAIRGISLTPTNATPASGTNTINVQNFAAGSGTSATAITNGINFASATGYTNFINSPSAVLTSAGALSGLTGLTVASGGATITAGGLTVTAGGASITGTTTINTTGTANTQIGNATGTFQLDSSALDISTAGALTGVTGITTSGGYTQSGSTANTFTGATTFINSADSTSAFQIQNAASTVLFTVNTTSGILSARNYSANESMTLGSELLSTWTNNGSWNNTTTNTYQHLTSTSTPLGTSPYTQTLTNAWYPTSTSNYYQVTFTVTGRTAGNFTISLGGQTSQSYSASSSWTPKPTSATVSDNLVITPSATFDGTIAFSVKQVTMTALNPTVRVLDSAGSSSLEIRTGGLTGNNNTFIGLNSGRYNNTGTLNVGLGNSALATNISGYANTGLGYASLTSNTAGLYNTATGYQSLYLNNTGSNNTAFGTVALFSNTSGNNNTGMGMYTLNYNSTGSSNTAVGYAALQGTSGNSSSSNVAMGALSLYNNYGNNNTAIGSYAMQTNTTSTNNVALGYAALYSNTTTNDNVAIGGQALYTSTSANNTAVGRTALYNLTTGAANAALGINSGRSLLTGSNNTFLGPTSGYDSSAATTTTTSATSASTTLPVTSASGIALGQYVSGTGITAGTYVAGISGLNITLSAAATVANGASVTFATQKFDASNSTAIGNTTVTTANNQVILGNSSVTQVNIQGNPSNSTYQTTTAGTTISGLLQLGNRLVSSAANTSANGGTYFGINAPSSGAGSAADFINFQANGTTKLQVTSAGLMTVGGGLTVSTGSTFTNASSTLFTALSISNLASGGAIGTAAATVDVATSFNVNQTTASQTLSLPTPTTTTAGRIVYVNNVGTADFTMHSVTVKAGTYSSFVYSGTAWVGESAAYSTTGGAGSGVTTVGTIDSQTKSANGAVISSTTIYLQNADATYPGLVSTGTQTFAGAKTFNGAVTMAAAGTGLSVTNSATIGTGLTVTSGGATITAGGLTVTAGGASITGTTTINTTGTANTQIGNATGTFQLDSSAFDVSTAGALSGITTISASGAITAATSTNTINGLIINSGALSGITGYTQTSGNFAMSGTGTFGTGTGAVSLNGNTTVKPASNSTATFQVQNSSSTPLMTVDSTNNKLTVATDILATGASTATTATTSGTGTNTTTLTFSGTTSFANGDVIFIDNVGQDYYTRITAGATAASVTVSPAVTFETGRTVTKYTVQSIGAVTSTNDYTTLNNRFFQGYFLGGVVTGAGSTSLSDGLLNSTTAMNFNSPSYLFKPSSNAVTAFQIQPTSSTTPVFNVDTTNSRIGIGNAAPTVALDVTGAMTASTTITAGTGLTVTSGGASITGNSTVNTSGSGTTEIGNASSTTTVLGTTNINTTGTASTQIGNGTGFLTNVNIYGPTGINTGSSTANTSIGNASSTTAIAGTNVNINTSTTTNTSIGNGTGTLQLTSNAFNVTTAGVVSGVTGYTQSSGNFAQNGSGTFSTGTGTNYLNGDVIIAGAKTFSTGSGAVSLNGDVTIASGKTLTVSGTGATTLGGTLGVTGNTTLTGLLTVANGITASSGQALAVTTANAAGAASYNISLTTGNVTSGAFASGNITLDTGSSTGTTGSISLGATNASAINIGRSGITTTINGTLNAVTAIQLNGTDINTAGTLSNVAYENQINTFTLANTFNGQITLGGGITTTAGTALSIKPGTPSSAASGAAITLTGGDANGANNGGNVTISPGAKGSSGSGGSVIIKPQASNDTATAFQVQNASSSVLLNSDTSNMRIAVNATYTSMSAPGTVTPVLASGGSLTVSTTYYYKVTAIDSLGGETTPSAEASLATTAGNLTINLSWTAVTGASGYRIYRSTSTNTEVLYAYTTKASYSDTGGGLTTTTTVPASNSAYVSSNVTQNYGQLSIGGNGTPAGQLYVSGTMPASILGSVSTGTSGNPQNIYVQGRYAYVANNGTGTMAILDVSNPSSPSQVSSISSSGASGIYVQGRYAYVANYGASNMKIFDISNPNSPSLAATVSTGTNPQSIYVQGRYAYVTNYGSNTMTIYDISNPATASQVGSISTGASTLPFSVYVQGRYAYVTNASGSANTMNIYDVSNPASPSLTGSVSTGTSPRSVYVQGRYAYVANYSSSTMTIYDVSNPASPSLIGSVNTGSGPRSVYVQGRVAYVTNALGHTMSIYDVSNPANPTQIGSSVSTGASSGPVGVFVQGRYAYEVNNSTNTMNVYDMGGAYVQQLEVGGTETGTLQVSTNASVFGDTSIQGGLSVGSNMQVSGSLGINGATVISPTIASAVGLTVNGTTGTAATALSVSQTGAATGMSLTSSSTGDGINISLTNTSGTQTNGMLINRNGAGGTTTNLLQLQNTAGTATNALTFTGTFTNLISSTNFTVTNAGAVTAASTITGTTLNGTTGINTGASAGTQRIDSSGNLVNINSLTLAGGQSPDLTVATPAAAGNGAAFLIRGGSSNGNNTGGQVTLQGGNGGGPGGAVNITGGSGGAVSLGAGVGGAVNITGGSGYFGNGGAVSIDSGAAAGAGSNGSISIGTTNAPTVTVGRSAATLNATGSTMNINMYPGASNTGVTITANTNESNRLFRVVAADTTIMFNVDSTVGSGSFAGYIRSGTAATFGLCTAANSGGYQIIRDCSSNPTGDYAEQYPVVSGASYGDIMVTGSKQVTVYDKGSDGGVDWNKPLGTVSELVKSSSLYQGNAIGIVSDNYGDFTSAGYNIKEQDNPMPVALNGRVPVNIAPDSAPIEPGDYITTSGTHAGKGTKATGAGYVVGKALEAWDPASGKTQVMVFVQNGFYPGPSMSSYIQNGASASLANLEVTGVANFNDINMSGTATFNELKVTSVTVSGNLEVKGLLKVADIEVNGHIITKGDTPAIAAEPNAGKDAVCSVTGNDTSGKITVTTGTADWANGTQCTITFHKPYSANPNPVITPAYVLGATTDTSSIKPYVDADTTTMRINFNAADNAPRTYIFNYFNAQ